MKKTIALILAIILTFSLVLATPARDEKNPKCEDLGDYSEFKIDPPVSGTFSVGTGSINAVINVGAGLVNWTSTFGIDKVIVKGGKEGAIVYDYSPESFGANGLVTPINPSGMPAGVSHVSFCYDDDGNDVPEFSVIGAVLFLGLAGLFVASKRH